ncbi:GNAT family N-acetyltransferase [Brevibacillus nitrificans]|uniref:GNAT family N-acetyltransferase n=1 Tax=Brevibacillus nitrificans TaxID=651560 RepID=UPI00285A6626|nr:GNAT family N-acetyltransferase [Brevibacillus nitrificans]MDR7314593.1 ribosomal protein S18 acetylase RimI-like enzyme [Brevibacillus nitrificans]
MATIADGKEYRLEVREVSGLDEEDLDQVKQLFMEYTHSLDIDLSFQDFEAEYKALPGKYGPPDGVLLLASVDGQAAGCIALRKIGEGICEMKRLYVRDAFRGLRIGKILIQAILEKASQLHYDVMRLDTLPTMVKAQALYHSFGFYHIEPYVFNPIEGAVFMEVKLNEDGREADQ